MFQDFKQPVKLYAILQLFFFVQFYCSLLPPSVSYITILAVAVCTGFSQTWSNTADFSDEILPGKSSEFVRRRRGKGQTPSAGASQGDQEFENCGGS